MDTVDLLKAFIATAQTGSFTGAAEGLGISNRLTSKYVAELETRLNTRLLQRTTRHVGLTATGYDLLERAPALLDELDNLLVSVSESSRSLTGILRISAPVTMGELYFKDLLSRFANLHPNLIIDLRLSDNYIDLASNGIDVGFRVGIPETASLKVRKLGTIRSSAIAAPAYLSQKGTPKTIDDLMDHACIIDTNRRGSPRWTFTKNGEKFSLTPNRRFMVNSGIVARDWALAGHGIALCPDFFITSQIADGTLVRLLEEYELSAPPLNAIYLEGAVLPTKVRALIDFTLEDIKHHPGLFETN